MNASGDKQSDIPSLSSKLDEKLFISPFGDFANDSEKIKIKKLINYSTYKEIIVKPLPERRVHSSTKSSIFEAAVSFFANSGFPKPF